MKNITVFGLSLMLALFTLLPVTADQEGKPCPTKETQVMESFTGKVEPMGMSIFMQGSHQLVDDKGEMLVILQPGKDVDLSKFEGKQVTVQGTVEDTVEAGGKILTVESIK